MARKLNQDRGSADAVEVAVIISRPVKRKISRKGVVMTMVQIEFPKEHEKRKFRLVNRIGNTELEMRSL